MAKEPTEYALYHGEQFIDVGTAESLGEQMGWSAEYVKWLGSPSAVRRFDAGSGNRYITVRLDSEDKRKRGKEMAIGSVGLIPREPSGYVDPQKRVDGWVATLNRAKHSGHKITIMVDELCLELAREGMSISHLRDDDPRLLDIRRAMKGVQPKPTRHEDPVVRDRIWNLYKMGLSPRRIGAEVERPARSVQASIRRQQNERDDHRDYTQIVMETLDEQDLTTSQIAEALGYSCASVSGRLQAVRRKRRAKQ